VILHTFALVVVVVVAAAATDFLYLECGKDKMTGQTKECTPDSREDHD
jgi:hypothetical protein